MMKEVAESFEQMINESEEKYRQLDIRSRELHHRVRNNMEIISCMLSLQSRYIKNGRCMEIFSDSRDRIKCMCNITDIFYLSKDLNKFEIDELITNMTKALFESHGVNKIDLILSIDKISVQIDQVTPLMLIVNELLIASLKHVYPFDSIGKIEISLFINDENKIELKFNDNGTCISFDAAKETDTMGLDIVTGLVNQLGGNMDMDVSSGTDFRIVFEQGK